MGHPDEVSPLVSDAGPVRGQRSSCRAGVVRAAVTVVGPRADGSQTSDPVRTEVVGLHGAG
ncbi:hypothetical protein GCM10018966_087870 [Streptomyces yanii]